MSLENSACPLGKSLITLAFLAALFLSTMPSLVAQEYRFSTENFVVSAPDPAFAKQVGKEAERFRRELAIEWLGAELPRWASKCPIKVSLAAHAGGETSFAFMFNGQQRGEPTNWDMKIFGTPERLLDSVLPHEVTHTIFATHFRRPLPRWADEGACTTVEHQAEKKKNHGMLIHFLTSQPSRGIPFNRMFTMRNYPPDILPLYAQGFSVAKFLIMEKGRRHFLDFVEAGMNLEQPGRELAAWDHVTKQYYGYEDLSQLQINWERWVAEGSIEKTIPANGPLQPTRPSPYTPKNSSPIVLANAAGEMQAAKPDDARLASLNEGWYAKQMKVGRRYRPGGKQDDGSDSESKSAPDTIWR